MEDPSDSPKAVLAAAHAAALQSFLATGHRLRFEDPDAPVVSVIVPLYNRAELAFRCLRALLEEREIRFELILVDDASTDLTPVLLDRLEGARLIRNARNRGFLRAVNQAARRSRGELLLLLNSDAELLPGSLAAAVATLGSSGEIGAVGGKLVLTNGRLQEAGSLCWQDGSCLGYGRGDSPLAFPYMFRRDVDFCSGAFLLTRRALFVDGGGFDEDYAPAYYEDADYCARLWEAGHRVVYEPEAVAVHFEFASSSSRAQAIALQGERQALFASKHAPWLAGKQSPWLGSVLEARSVRGAARRVLFIDDRVPRGALGAGFPRTREMLRAMQRLGHAVTFYPLSFPDEDWGAVYAEIPRETEVALGCGESGLPRFLAERAGYYDVVLVSRPHNMERLRAVLARAPDALAGASLVYDAEAIFALRDVAGRRLAGEVVAESEAAELVRVELALAQGVRAVACVSAEEQQRFSDAGIRPAFVLAHAVAAAPTPEALGSRSGLLFVGALHEDRSPNADAVLWFASEVLPKLSELHPGASLTLAGLNRSARVASLPAPGVVHRGSPEDLSPLYAAARVFVAPTRFGAGLPLKCLEAAARGVPIVCTSLAARQLGWRDGVEALVADEPFDFAEASASLLKDDTLWRRLRSAALERVEKTASPEVFTNVMKELLDAAVGPVLARVAR